MCKSLPQASIAAVHCVLLTVPFILGPSRIPRVLSIPRLLRALHLYVFSGRVRVSEWMKTQTLRPVRVNMDCALAGSRPASEPQSRSCALTRGYSKTSVWQEGCAVCGVCALVSRLPLLRGASVQERGDLVLKKSSLRWWFTLLKWHLISFVYCAPSVGRETKSAGLERWTLGCQSDFVSSLHSHAFQVLSLRGRVGSGRRHNGRELWYLQRTRTVLFSSRRRRTTREALFHSSCVGEASMHTAKYTHSQ